MADYLLPKLPEKDKDGNIDVDSQMNFNKNVLQLLQKKISDDTNAENEISGSIPDICSSAEAIAGTNDTKIITPLKLRNGLNASGSAPIYACRAWVNFNGTGTVAIRASGNVSGITDNGTGDYTINFTTAMEDANYGVSLSNAEPSPPTADSVHNGIMYGQTTTSVRTRSWSWAGSVTDQPYQYVMVFR